MQVFIIEENNLGEEHRLPEAILSLSLPAYLQHGNGGKLRKTSGSRARSHCDERIIPAAAGHGVEFIFPALEALLVFPYHIGVSLLLRSGLVDAQAEIFSMHFR